MSDWSKHAVQVYQRKRDDARIKNQVALQEQQLLDLEAPRRWAELRNSLMQQSCDFNAEPGMDGTLTYDHSRPDSLTIENTEQHTAVRVVFSGQHHEVTSSDRFAKV